MRKLTLIAALSVLAMPAWADDAALLIGVDRYEEFRRVSNADDVLNSADSLRDADYQVSTLANGDSVEMARLVQRFAVDAEDADRLVVGLAGRFVTDGDRTWLLPADAQRPTLFGMGTALSVDSVLQVLAQQPGQAVLILGYDQDADATIGSYLRQGVGTLDVPQGVTVFYGEPDLTDGVVMEAITEPGGDAMAFARRSRGLNVVGYQPRSLVLQPEATTVADPAPGPIGTTRDTLREWTSAQVTNSADSYRDFLFEFPDSPFASEARRRLDAIENDPQRLAEIAEDALNLTRNQRRAIQRNLTLMDFNTRGVDGIFGPGTRGAVRNWQQVNGFAQTGFLTTEQINRLDAQASRRSAEVEAEEERAREEALNLDRAYWEETGAREDEAGYRAYLNRYPDGIFADEARSKLAEREDDGADAALEAERALNINPVVARLIESRLQQLGFNPGRVDGRFDRDTRSAIARYQTRNGLSGSGYLDQPTLARLLADTFGR